MGAPYGRRHRRTYGGTAYRWDVARYHARPRLVSPHGWAALWIVGPIGGESLYWIMRGGGGSPPRVRRTIDLSRFVQAPAT